MVSLTTVYILSVILTSIAGVGSSFAANKVRGGAVRPPAPVPPVSLPPDEEDDRYKEEQAISVQQPSIEQTEQAIALRPD